MAVGLIRVHLLPQLILIECFRVFIFHHLQALDRAAATLGYQLFTFGWFIPVMSVREAQKRHMLLQCYRFKKMTIQRAVIDET